jgi:glycosyltransferase involved in cell wall biosynthesis
MRGTGIELRLTFEEDHEEHASLECLVHMGLVDCGQVKPASEKMLDLTILIPTLNEEAGIGRTIDEIRTALEGMHFEILVVDGRSDDGTDRIASEKGAIVIYQQEGGYGNALRVGFLHVRQNMRSKAVVTIDADSSYDARDIASLLEPIMTDRADLVVGDRFPKLQKHVMPTANRAGNKILSWMTRVALGVSLHDTQCGLRALRTELIDKMSMNAEGMPFATEMIGDIHFALGRISEVPVAYRQRVGRSKLRLFRDGTSIAGTIARLAKDARSRRHRRTRGQE